MILIAGHAGAGKTTLATEIVHEGCSQFHQPGVYVCFSGGTRTLFENARRLGWDLHPLVEKGLLTILELTNSGDEDLQANLNRILDAVSGKEAPRLVIDSFSALTPYLDARLDLRVFLDLLRRFLQRLNGITLLLIDLPWGSQSIPSGVEEFVADGVILLQSQYGSSETLQRRLQILKMRATNHSKRTLPYEIGKRGFLIVPPLNEGKA